MLAGLCADAHSQEAGGPGQESRQGLLAAQQAEKSGKIQPRQPNKAEALVDWIEDVFVEDPSGFYPYLGSVYHGGGLTLGPGYRKYFGDHSFWDIKGLYSVKNYKLLEGRTESRDHLGRRLSFGSRLGWRDATQVGYYGLGTQSKPEDRANFRFKQTYADGHFVFLPVRWVPVRGTAPMSVGIPCKDRGPILPSRLATRLRPPPVGRGSHLCALPVSGGH